MSHFETLNDSEGRQGLLARGKSPLLKRNPSFDAREHVNRASSFDTRPRKRTEAEEAVVGRESIVQSDWGARWEGLNRNVRNILGLVLLAGISESMGFGATLSSYLYISTGKSNFRYRLFRMFAPR